MQNNSVFSCPAPIVVPSFYDHCRWPAGKSRLGHWLGHWPGGGKGVTTTGLGRGVSILPVESGGLDNMHFWT